MVFQEERAHQTTEKKQVFWSRALDGNWQRVILHPAVSSPHRLPWHQGTCGALGFSYWSLLATEDEERNTWIVEATYFFANTLSDFMNDLALVAFWLVIFSDFVGCL